MHQGLEFQDGPFVPAVCPQEVGTLVGHLPFEQVEIMLPVPGQKGGADEKGFLRA